MSLENVEAVRRSFDARNRGDIDAVLADTAEDVEVDFSRSRAPWAGVYRGRESLREAWQRLVESFDSVWWEAEEFIDAGEAVVVISRFYTRGRGSGVESVAHGAQVYWVEDGKIVRYVQCQNRAEALEAVGFGDPPAQ